MKRHAFWIGSLLFAAGVLLHVPDYVMARHDHFMMAGMPMGRTMSVGMALIVAGLALCVWRLLPAREERAARARRAPAAPYAALDEAPLTRAHWLLVVVLTVGLVVDTMKPASLGFVVPGMAKEYGISTREAATLPFVAITGTVVGSILWGFLADVFGRRSTILLSAIIYIATSICGFMPSLGWNLVMCFFMGASAGGMLPTVYSLMAESIPARRRGGLIVLQSGLGAALGYLVASGASTLLVPHFSWRILWVLGAPTGALLLLLSRWIPESPRFLLSVGRDEEAARVMARYGITTRASGAAPAAPPAWSSFPSRVRALVVPPFRRRTATITLYGLGWGIVNWGFITFLPTFLGHDGKSSASGLLFFSSLFAVPNTALAAYLYGRWGSRRTMFCYAGITGGVLVLFPVLGVDGDKGRGLLLVLLVSLLAGAGGMIALLSPYATEVYPTALRAGGSGLAAAAGKVGGMLGPLLLTSAPELRTMALIVALPVGAAGLVLWVTGMETAGRPLVEAETG
ncbi:MFS transporter [Actinoallomurus purpureus]|uniref:MFS transporter n=1 Tax=Actinoallomurus purpureus TaxID=478114 RepID=UPI002092A193|nr:MFS transporter [Actinoallomurus purpureus]MCO6005193.1 MFS transporter [Actinoallomurus purpureus]